MAEKKQITVNLDEKSIEKLDTNRAQVLRLLLSGNRNNIKFVCDTLLSIEDGLFGGVHDQPKEEVKGRS
ncbi:hypothetical protein E4K67_29055 [Desulfosporosinus fructosivorans]|uniref:Uncharacterized protein n=1 Tax=Desulfosporosinus fructosivorans TaxID=2018669 RepID=A0A4Z0QW54_9FIRM|nr:hypothetical protein [Desulfosporosinus fructosivorans]TGE34744.1 hypothetical protein E4K67_29055 [Desulfosporosinus fructosivorans]